MFFVVCPSSHTNRTNSELSFALQPGSDQEALEAGCCKDLGIMDTVQELGYAVCEDALEVTGGLNIQDVEVMVIMVDQQLLPGVMRDMCVQSTVPTSLGKSLNDANHALMGAKSASLVGKHACSWRCACLASRKPCRYQLPEDCDTLSSSAMMSLKVSDGQ